jgi:hypothetical protein
MKYTIGTSYVVEKIPEHNNIKNTILDKINDLNTDKLDIAVNTYPVNEHYTGRDVISNQDYFTDQETPYLDFIQNESSFINVVDNIFYDLGYNDYIINEWWFQQYKKNDNHSWHTHGACNWSIVYYVELPKETPPTLLLDLSNKNIIEPNVKEGDIIIFPSNTPHTSPPNPSEKRKTIISMNVECNDCHDTIDTTRNP